MHLLGAGEGAAHGQRAHVVCLETGVGVCKVIWKCEVMVLVVIVMSYYIVT